jgi:hypothetical protein
LAAGLRTLLLALACAFLALSPAAAQNIESVLAPGKLIQGHAKVDDDCKACHVKFDRAAQDGRCTECHKEVGKDFRDKAGFHGRQKPQPCRECHTDHKGREARIVELDEKAFDHKQTDYALEGKHQPVACKSCHLTGKRWREAPQDCYACHKKDDVHKGKLGPKCADCHTVADWKKAQFDHGKTRFALSGKHVDVKCADCHKTPDYKDTPRSCIGCHKKDDDTQVNGRIGHKGLYGDKCESCHNAKAWKPATFNHDTDTRYKLTGKHRDAACKDCHTGHLYKQKVDDRCLSCHRKDDETEIKGRIGHKGQYGEKCESCHATKAWKPSTFVHDTDTKYRLLGKHKDTACKSCHTAPLYKSKTSTDCYSCHKKDDKHKDTLGKDCAACHNERSWKDEGRKFDHDRTSFPLLGKHVTTECKACHKSLMYKEAPKDCLGCHQKDDKHKGNLGKACGDCHNERDWKDTRGRFDHDRTKFALRNGHVQTAKGVKVECKACHAALDAFRNTATDCLSCHKKDDKHEGQSGKACQDCHNDRSWKVTSFDHARTRFALAGRHVTVACKDCHTGMPRSLRFRDAQRDCVSCHKKDDKHKLRLGVACESCHNVRSWKSWDFDHNRRSQYKLDGAHIKLRCETCHTREAPQGKAIAPVGSTCAACHRGDDVHDGSFGMRCEQCHVTDNWKRITNRGLSLWREAAPSDERLRLMPSAPLFAVFQAPTSASVMAGWPMADEGCALGWSSRAGTGCRTATSSRTPS